MMVLNSVGPRRYHAEERFQVPGTIILAVHRVRGVLKPFSTEKTFCLHLVA